MTSTQVHPVDFEPSLVEGSTYATRRRHTQIDVAAILSIMIVLLYVLPGALIVPNLTYAGRPALLVAFLLFFWWVLARLSPRLSMIGPQPVRWAAFVYMTAILLSYLAGLIRGLPTLEANAQNFAVLLMMEFLGIMLVAADGLPNWERLGSVLRVFVCCAGFMAVTGILQSTVKVDVASYLAIPGLELKGGLVGFQARGTGGHIRVAGTATHYIEFSAVMAMATPFAIHCARFAATKLQRWGFTFITLIIMAAIPISISRTGVVALAGALLVMVPVWSWRTRYNLMFFAALLTVGLMVLRPGLLGTIRSMFTSADEDPSVTARTQRYDLVFHWFWQRPWLGRGPSTLIPELNQGLVLDNQWLYTLVTGGVVGVLALAALHITCISVGVIALRRATRPEDRHLCAALISTQFIAMIVAGTFDSMYYTTLTSTIALMIGVSGAVWRFTHPARTIRTLMVRRYTS